MSLLDPKDVGSSDPVQPSIPWAKRVGYTTAITAIQATFFAIGIRMKMHKSPFEPNMKKCYPCRSRLANHIFLPPKYDELTTELYPLYLDIHGGGYCIGEPADDDEFCSAFSKHFGIIVVSLNYSKAPQYPYPAAFNDIVAIADAVINDPTLRIDKKRVAIGGFSAGGALALAVCQSQQLRGQIKACCPTYPPTDLSKSAEEKLKTRPWREQDKGADMLARAAAIFDYSYINPGTRLKDPKLSPSYVTRSDLPEWVFIVGSEFDMLCFEARALACRLGGLEIPNGHEGQSDETGLEEKYGWKRDGGRIRWMMARGMTHNFAVNSRGKPEEEEARREKFKEIWMETGKWLFEGAFAPGA